MLNSKFKESFEIPSRRLRVASSFVFEEMVRASLSRRSKGVQRCDKQWKRFEFVLGNFYLPWWGAKRVQFSVCNGVCPRRTWHRFVYFEIALFKRVFCLQISNSTIRQSKTITQTNCYPAVWPVCLPLKTVPDSFMACEFQFCRLIFIFSVSMAFLSFLFTWVKLLQLITIYRINQTVLNWTWSSGPQIWREREKFGSSLELFRALECKPIEEFHCKETSNGCLSVNDSSNADQKISSRDALWGSIRDLCETNQKAWISSGT